MTTSGKYFDNIIDKLSAFKEAVQRSSKLGRTNINKDAERLFCYPLSLLFDGDFVNLNTIEPNFPAVDLGCMAQGISVQVTSTNDHEKIQKTLDKFFAHELHTKFSRVIILIIGEKKKYHAFNYPDHFSFSTYRDVWDIDRLLQEIESLPGDKLRALSDHLDQELASLDISKPHLCLPPVSAVGEGFVGRQEELEQIREKLGNHVKPVILSGLGGMGKTELAVRFGLNYEDGNVYFIRFSESFTATVTAMFRGVSPQPQDPPPEDEQYRTVMALLRSCGEQDLLIIDNVDADSGTLRDLMKDQTYKQLKDMNLRLILTTRFDEARSVGIHPMPNDALYEIFEKHGGSLEESQMDALIEAVNGHTLTIDLMARILNGKGWRKVTAEMLLHDLRTNALPNAQYRKIATDYNQSEDQAQIYQHLSVVFDATGVPEDGKDVLRCATLLPEGGMNGEYFANTMNEDGQEILDTLIDHGWLNAEDGVITIHPVIRLVCREELTPDEETCGAFLDALWDLVDFTNHERVKFAQMAEVFANAMEIDGRPETKADWLNISGVLLLHLTESRKAVALYERYIPELEQKIPTHPALATSYNNVGSTYYDLGNHKKALEYKLKALAICEKVLPPEHPDLAQSYNNVGVTYSALGDHSNALEYQLKSLAICEKVLPPEHPSLGASYNNMGMTYGDLGNHSKALEYLLKALAICEKVLPPEHPDLASSYDNVGITYGDLGDHSKALEYQLKALAIRKKVLPSTHPDLAQSYNNVGVTYGALGDHSKALEYQLKALAIFEKELPADHPFLASSYNNVGMTHADLGDHCKALEYLLKSLGIREKVLPPEHPDLATSYNNVGITNFHLKQYATAMEYLEKALAIYEKSLPAGHPDTESTRENIAYIKKQMSRKPFGLRTFLNKLFD